MMVVRNVSKVWGGKAALDGVSVEFPGEQMTALIGPNGAGKSTLLMVMARLLKPTGGQVLLDGCNVAHLRSMEYARQVATLRQSPGVSLRLTVRELIAFGRFPHSRGTLTADDHRAVDQALAFLSLDALRHAWVDELSGGQRQLAYLAMTIAQQTPVLLLDEPLNNLDIRHAVHIMQALRRLCQGELGAKRSVILVIHDVNFAANYADHVVALKDGALCFQGSPKDCMTADRLAALYGLGFEILRGAHGCVCNYFTSPTGSDPYSTPMTGAVA